MDITTVAPSFISQPPQEQPMPANKRMHVKKTATITLLAIENPKRKNTLSFTRFALYKNGMTVGDYIAAGGRSGDVNYDVENGYISISHGQEQ